MKMRFVLFSVVLSVLCLQSCDDGKTSAAESEESNADLVSEDVNVEASTNSYLIENGSFYGINVGDNISDRSLEKDMLKNGEGEFEIYHIKNEEGERIGYVLPDVNDETLVGDIVITSTAAETKEKMRVGMTLEELEAALGDVTIHGSEIEGYTSIEKDNIIYGLDTYQNTYEVDRSKVAPTTRIKEIRVRRSMTN